MSLHVSVIGIDGSGKSTLAASLPMLLAAEYNVLAGGAGDDMLIAGRGALGAERLRMQAAWSGD